VHEQMRIGSVQIEEGAAMKNYYSNARRSLWLCALMMGIVILWGCSPRVSRTYEGPSLIGRYTLKIAIRYDSVSQIAREASQGLLPPDSPRRLSEASPLREDPLNVARASLIAQAEGTGLFKQVGVDLPSPDYTLSGNVGFFRSIHTDSLGTHVSYETKFRAYLQDVEEGMWIWNGEGIGAELLHVSQVVNISPLDSREMVVHRAPWLAKWWSPRAISEAAHEVMKQAAAVIAEREVLTARISP